MKHCLQHILNIFGILPSFGRRYTGIYLLICAKKCIHLFQLFRFVVYLQIEWDSEIRSQEVTQGAFSTINLFMNLRPNIS